MSSNSSILRKLSKKEAFHFLGPVGNKINESAVSFEEFLEKIKKVDAESLEFHLYRGDFENWISEILGDEELAEEISGLRKLNLKGKTLQEHLHFTILKRYSNFKNEQDQITTNNNEMYEEMEEIVDKLANHLGKMEKNIKKITKITEFLHISEY